mgnify:CR=1 FL=1
MAKKKNFIDSGQTSIFDVIQEARSVATAAPSEEGTRNIDGQLRRAVSDALKRCPLSRYQVAARMSELMGIDVTKSSLDSWTAESKDQHRFPAAYLPAFCTATGSRLPLEVITRATGGFLMPGGDALRSEIQRLDEEITTMKRERQKRLLFLREMDGKN